MIIKRFTFLLAPLVILLFVGLDGHTTSANNVTADFGDAPDATNNTVFGMKTYEGVTAYFPTAVVPASPPYGPQHLNDSTVFLLGERVSAEEQAESGHDEDTDGINNIMPMVDDADNDGADDGMELPLSFAHCQQVTLKFQVRVLKRYDGPIYANLWSDWNRDGDWKDTAPGDCVPGREAAEWVMQNRRLDVLTPGRHTFEVTFTPYVQSLGGDRWLRLSVSEKEANSDGSAPKEGYLYGETEDFYMPQLFTVSNLPMITGAGRGQKPGEPDKELFEERDLPEAEISAEWVQIPEGTTSRSVRNNQVQLRLTNSAARAIPVSMEMMMIADGAKQKHKFRGVTVPAGGSIVVNDALGWPDNIGHNWRSPATFLGEVSYDLPDAMGPIDRVRGVPVTVAIPQAYMHKDTTAADHVVLYNEDGYYRQVQAMAFDRNADLGPRLRERLPPGPIPKGRDRIIVYEGDDPILKEPAPDDDPDIPRGITPQSQEALALICLEWFTAPTDNNVGEDYGLQDTGWRARGANVRIAYNGETKFDGYLNTGGCAVVDVEGGGGDVYIEYRGYSRLQSAGGWNYLHRKWTNLVYVEPFVWIGNVQPGLVYRPEIGGHDALGMISWAAQKRFNGGVGGFQLTLIKDECNGNGAASCFDVNYFGEQAMFINNANWKKKYVVSHNYGHAILWQVANYSFDCTYNYEGVSSNMETIEYASCAAMEGWANFVAGDIWNSKAGVNPDGAFVRADGVVYGLDFQYSKCYSEYWWLTSPPCFYIGVGKDWMRQWWDYHTNNYPGGIAFPPTHLTLMQLIDDVHWETGLFPASYRIQQELFIPFKTRWELYTCTNGVDTVIINEESFC